MAASTRSKAVGAPLGPGSLLWSTAGDPRALLTGSTAGILQLMLPGLGAGVTDHSDFFEDPFARIYRSIPVIWASIFSDDEEGTEVGHRIRDFHPDIKGTDHAGRHGDRVAPDAVGGRDHGCHRCPLNAFDRHVVGGHSGDCPRWD